MKIKRTDIQVRFATPGDLKEITRIRTSVRENHLTIEQLTERGITEHSVACRMQSGELGAWVATINTKVSAFAMADKLNGNLFALFTDPDCEGLGCGSRLLTMCEDWLRGHNVVTAHLDTSVSSKAESFYLRRGWTAVCHDGHDVFMTKRL